MTCSILGCGWLGLPLAKFLLAQGLDVKGSTTREEKLAFLKDQKIDPYLVRLYPDHIDGEIDAFLASDVLVLNFPPDRNLPDVKDSFPRTFKYLLEKIKISKPKHIIFVSSTSVYGNNSGDKVNESSPLEPLRSSGKALVMVENMLIESGISSTILRMAGLVGYNRKPGRFLAGRRNLGLGNAPVNLVHQDDCIRVIWEVIHQHRWEETFNVCADLHPSRKDFYTFAARQQGLTEPHFLEDNSLPGGKWVSNEKLKQDLHFEFLYPDPFKMVEENNEVLQN